MLPVTSSCTCTLLSNVTSATRVLSGSSAIACSRVACTSPHHHIPSLSTTSNGRSWPVRSPSVRFSLAWERACVVSTTPPGATRVCRQGQAEAVPSP